MLIERCREAKFPTITSVIGCPVHFTLTINTSGVQYCSCSLFPPLSLKQIYYIFCCRDGVQKVFRKNIQPQFKIIKLSLSIEKMVESEDYSGADEGDSYNWMDPISSKKGDKKRRFSEEQVKSLELMFETHAKLEPRKKLQLAKELGLHPRQVAIWFQNKRARWKSKQMEKEYNALRADYDTLLSSFESLKNEKQLLAKQLQKLAELLDKSMEETGKESDYSKTNHHQIRPNLLLADKQDTRPMSSDDEDNQYKKFGDKETEDFFCELPIGGGSLVPSEQQQFCFRQPTWPPDQSCPTSQWWEFWPMNE